ncbi:outer membrane beta-barrel protein [Pedobacter sp. HMF7647]|uniref:Outer membrane beta-barrel protein n=1 Tax=Hufsiella arboris TaxID=2695275 RepID=A0A7K1YA13_9SPHI|nr:porin family protein [Hufsiella arboris]MXV51427.1 outer membrane beta-barrel protein [Hufsiella arboris]
MKKLLKLTIATSLIIVSNSAISQTKTTGESTARFGVKAGVNLSKYSGKNSYDYSPSADYANNIGFNFTAYGDFGISKNFFIEPGISLQNKGSKLKANEDLFYGFESFKFKQTVFTIEIPVNAVWRIPTGSAGDFQLSAGPYIGFNIAGRNKLEGNFVAGPTVDYPALKFVTNTKDIDFGDSNDDDLKTIDFGINAGLTYRLNNGFLLSGNYGWGLTNLVPDNKRDGDDKLENRVLSFSVGYSF